MEEVQEKKPSRGRPKAPARKFNDDQYNANGSVKIATDAAREVVQAGIKPEYEITAFQRDHCYVFRAWSWTEPNGRQAPEIEREHNITYSKAQYKELAGGDKNKKQKRAKKSCAPADYLRAVHGENLELINEPKY